MLAKSLEELKLSKQKAKEDRTEQETRKYQMVDILKFIKTTGIFGFVCLTRMQDSTTKNPPKHLKDMIISVFVILQDENNWFLKLPVKAGKNIFAVFHHELLNKVNLKKRV